jgi:hypothetical protein
MSLSSSSTLAQIEAYYLDNASYHESGDGDMCRRFITACRYLLLKMPKMQGTREGQLTLSPELIQTEKLHAENWLAANGGTVTGPGGTPGGGGTSTRVSFRNSRD